MNGLASMTMRTSLRALGYGFLIAVAVSVIYQAARSGRARNGSWSMWWRYLLAGSIVRAILRPALVQPHKKKTAEDRRIKAKDDRIRRRHLGIRPKSRFAGSKDSPLKKKINGQVVAR